MTMETKWTPGPWIKKTHHRLGRDWDGNEKKIPCWYVSAENDVGIAVQPSYSDPRNEEANANLIAAAPDLYEALSALVQRWIDPGSISTEHWQNAAAALRKARGEQP